MKKASDVCFCGHDREIHLEQRVYSRASESYISTDLCAVKRCKCKHFEKTTFIPPSGEFNTDTIASQPESGAELQMEMLR